MNGLLRSGVVTAALGALITYVATHLQTILSDAVLSWILIAVGAAVTCLAFSWGWTQAYKFFFVNVDATSPPDQLKQSNRRIYAVAMFFCLMPAIALGSVLLLLHVDHQVRMVFGIVWGVGSLALCGASPWLWRVVFLQAVPWMLAKENPAGRG